MPAIRLTDRKFPPSAAPPRFAIERVTEASTARLAVTGELDIGTAPQLEGALRRAEVEARTIVVDLHRLDSMAVCSIRLLVEADTRIRGTGGRLTIENAPARFRRVLALTGTTGALDLGPPTFAQ